MNYSGIINQVVASLGDQAENEKQRKRLKTTLGSFTANTQRGSNAWKQQDHIGNMCRMLCSVEDYTLSWFQQDVCDKMLELCAPVIYRDIDPTLVPAMLRKYRLELTGKNMLYARCSRRAGKTDIMTAFVALMLLFVRNIKMIYYSLFELTCEIACTTVCDWLTKWGRMRGVKATKLSITITWDDGSTGLIIFLGGQSIDVSHLCYVFRVVCMSCVSLCVGPRRQGRMWEGEREDEDKERDKGKTRV
jgi:hypothetical protein